MENKICTKCKKEKPLEEFYNSKNGKFGKRSACKICTNTDNMSRYTKEASLKYYYKNREKILEQQRKTYALDNSKKKEYVEKNKEEIYKKIVNIIKNGILKIKKRNFLKVKSIMKLENR